MAGTKDEKRGYERYDFPSTIEYVLEHQEDGVIRKGVAINMSISGLSAYVFESLPVGQKVIINNGIPVAQYQPATICWSKEKDPDFFISGLKFN
jgi:hypothetical protein